MSTAEKDNAMLAALAPAFKQSAGRVLAKIRKSNPDEDGLDSGT